MKKTRIEEGIFLILAGIFFLLYTFRIIRFDIINYILRLWPVILILVGADLIVRKFWFKYVCFGVFAVCLLGYYFWAKGYIEVLM